MLFFELICVDYCEYGDVVYLCFCFVVSCYVDYVCMFVGFVNVDSVFVCFCIFGIEFVCVIVNLSDICGIVYIDCLFRIVV